MKKYAQTVIDLLLYTNVYIALAAAALTHASFFLVRSQQVSWPITGLVFFSTWFIYLLHRLISILQVDPFLHTIRIDKLSKLNTLNISLTIVAAVGILIHLPALTHHHFILLSACGLLSVFYAVPIPFLKKRLRDINFIKIVLISVTWAIVTIILPWIEAGQAHWTNVFLLSLERALFIFAITLPFDIRDRKIDTQYSLKTLSNTIGTKNTIYLSCSSLILATLISLFSMPLYSSGILICIYFLIAAYITRTSDKRSDYFYTAGLDGSIFLVALGIALSQFM